MTVPLARYQDAFSSSFVTVTKSIDPSAPFVGARNTHSDAFFNIHDASGGYFKAIG
jgi:hypothetical protein